MFKLKKLTKGEKILKENIRNITDYKVDGNPSMPYLDALNAVNEALGQKTYESVERTIN